MNRTKRLCAYRDCEVNSHSNPERTLFQFPKDEKRADLWREAGVVDPIDNVPQFMCDKHFSRIYMCFSSRRKMLLNTAVPKPYGFEEDEMESEQVQSSSADTDGITIEEHLDESFMEDGDSEGTLTEIIYIDHMKDGGESSENTRKRKAFSPPTTPVKVDKIQKLPSSGTSTVVSSSTPTTATILNSTLKQITPPMGTILRKVKLRKRSQVIPFTSTKLISQNADGPVDPTVTVIEEAVEATVSSSPEKKISPAKSLPSTPTASAISHNTNSSSKSVGENQESPGNSKKSAKITEEKNESIYEFIFKGEEYIQMPKAMYHEKLKLLEKQANQSQLDVSALKKKLDYYRNMVKDLKEFLDALQEENME